MKSKVQEAVDRMEAALMSSDQRHNRRAKISLPGVAASNGPHLEMGDLITMKEILEEHLDSLLSDPVRVEFGPVFVRLTVVGIEVKWWKNGEYQMGEPEELAMRLRRALSSHYKRGV